MEQLAQIETMWEAKGSPYCEHTRVSRETSPGAGTGDLGCLDCGHSWPRRGGAPEPRGVRPAQRSAVDEVAAVRESAGKLKTAGRFGENPAEESVRRHIEAIWGALEALAQRVDAKS